LIVVGKNYSRVKSEWIHEIAVFSITNLFLHTGRELHIAGRDVKIRAKGRAWANSIREKCFAHYL
jgi:hypothetical protein